ncbi:MAG TPA: tRNA-dihydrouridine synthase [Patescibacteria group bacterium]|nr:tRNA-dihydrouridine synthase [Patescibacteria group bacterium]
MSYWSKLTKPFFALAPMDGATDTVFRQVVAKAGRPDVFFTEFVNTDGYCSPDGRHSTEARLRFTSTDQPLIAQIWGTKPEHFALMAKDLASMGYVGIDINMGCPVRDVIKRGACSALIQTPDLAAKIITATKEGGLPVSVKTRIGFNQPNTDEWIGFLLKQDLAALTIHARTAKELSKVPAHWQEIAKAVKLRDKIAPQTLIIGNGDVADRADGLHRIAETGADGIMIGRGAFNNVFCFEQNPRHHTPAEYLELLHYHLDLFEQTWQGQKRSYQPLKRFFKIYVRDFAGAGELREALMNTKDINEARTVLDSSRI